MPRLRFPEFLANSPWEPKELAQLLTAISNGISLPQNSSGLGLRVTRIETIADGKINLDRVGYVDSPSNEIEDYRLKAGDILLSNINSITHIGKSVLINEDLDVYHGMNLLRLQVDTKSNYPQFVYFSINTPVVRGSIRERANKAVNQASINQTELGRTIIPSPSRVEQEKVADCLSSLDELITAETQNLDTLRIHKKGLMQQLFPREGETVPQLRFPEFRNLGEWKEKSISDFGDIITGSTPSTAHPEFYEGGIPFVSPADISDLRWVNDTKTTLSAWGFEKTRPIKANSILFVCIGSTIGKVTQNARDCATNQQINSVIPNSEHSSGFVYYILSLNAKRIAKLAGIQAVPIINKTQFSAVRLLVPEFSEQDRIAKCLSSLDDFIATQSQKVDALIIYKKGLMEQLFPVMPEVR
ncbi:TPA: restriction endonuclease subunit S [Pseudomonas aeruginosa]|nr:restriction endonuclease subunit S [Pseudomonas aeruginosa]